MLACETIGCGLNVNEASEGKPNCLAVPNFDRQAKKSVTIIMSHKLRSCSNLYLDTELHLLPPGHVLTCTLNLADDVTIVLGHEVAYEADHTH